MTNIRLFDKSVSLEFREYEMQPSHHPVGIKRGIFVDIFEYKGQKYTLYQQFNTTRAPCSKYEEIIEDDIDKAYLQITKGDHSEEWSTRKSMIYDGKNDHVISFHFDNHPLQKNYLSIVRVFALNKQMRMFLIDSLMYLAKQYNVPLLTNAHLGLDLREHPQYLKMSILNNQIINVSRTELQPTALSHKIKLEEFTDYIL